MPEDDELHRIVRRAISWPGDSTATAPGEKTYDWQARAVLTALEREGYSIIRAGATAPQHSKETSRD